MKQAVLIDTGPIVALINRREQFHQWVTNQFRQIEPPLLTCEAVITEACFLLQNVYGGEAAVISFVQKGIIQVPFRLSEEAVAVFELMQRYQSVPMSLADACLVKMAELYPKSELLTFDSDFRIYRKNREQLISTIMPENS
ncbi:PIN domain-containing protein [Nostoc sp. CENA67]|uniref:PIN domain-containing protein n=1 Tax=Amazonocrinis nigriterrae CENA67 TaxID=2794033 RepID=A0A8J7HQ07_9NOST|nr:PIN domain-containing protein [Amazonocrinis nigriterrae]MBH8563472.1 PIN domain-containing protein [Amazonocrinis nigriterrae CENA67]